MPASILETDQIKVRYSGLPVLHGISIRIETGETVCVESNRPDPTFDHNGDCVIDLQDFALFVGNWLDCGLLPDCIQ